MENKPNSIKTFATGHPFFFALAFFAVSFCLDIGISLVGRTLLPMAYVAAIDKAVQFLLALGMLAWLDWLQAAGFNGPSRWRSLHLLWLPALLALLYLASLSVTPLSSPAVVVFAAISVLLTGLHEETRFRGLILQALLPYGPLGGAALSALFFGLFHLVNLLAL